MAKSGGLLLLAAIFIATLVISSSKVDASGDYQIDWLPMRSTCDGSIGECLDSDEFEMDTEINRRVLATTRYISYGALKRNSVPCSRRGASYYNCKRGAQANPYRRGCNRITRCRS
ncbi:protein RALF-like 33 [Macadamia integrifolia]|uniref:protein RALF-like 33 n=1 Tax=Macadamia integrifolia TaxID=60698 RepID=UPI001C4ECAD1|nr:protein RALF-like 33 [Macadamia integrifolia]